MSYFKASVTQILVISLYHPYKIGSGPVSYVSFNHYSTINGWRHRTGADRHCVGYILVFTLCRSSSFYANLSGGGIGGLAFAVALAKVPGIEVHIYEAASAFTDVGAGIGTWSRGWEVLKKLGLDQELRSLAAPVAEKEGPSESHRF